MRPTNNWCGKGHQYTPENTYIRTGGARVCRKCANERINWKGPAPGQKQQAPEDSLPEPDLTSSLPLAIPNGVSPESEPGVITPS